MTQWDVWSLVVGEKLPEDWLTIPGLEIHRAPDEEVAQLRELRIDMPVEFDPGRPDHFDVSRAPVHVESGWILRFELEAENLDDALEKARAAAAIYSSTLDSLTPDARQPFHLEILAVGDHETGRVMAMPLAWSVHPVRVSALSDEDSSALDRRLSVLQKDAGDASTVARAAARLLRDATYLADTSMEVELLENASLLLYFGIIERIAHFVVKSQGGADADALDSERTRIADQLSAALLAATSPDDVSKLIHAADYELRQVEATHLKARILAAGEAIGLARSLVEEAQAFLDLRSSHLAHFGSALPYAARVRWFHQRNARRIAAYFFAAFLDWLHSNKETVNRA